MEERTSWTLGHVKEFNLLVEGHCQTAGCRHFYVFDLDQLIARAGPDYVLPETIPDLTCQHCGGALKAVLAAEHQ